MMESAPGFSKRGTSLVHTYSSASGEAGPSGVILGVFEISMMKISTDTPGRVPIALSGHPLATSSTIPALGPDQWRWSVSVE
jgi:hypothetical protein